MSTFFQARLEKVGLIPIGPTITLPLGTPLDNELSGRNLSERRRRVTAVRNALSPKNGSRVCADGHPDNGLRVVRVNRVRRTGRGGQATDCRSISSGGWSCEPNARAAANTAAAVLRRAGETGTARIVHARARARTHGRAETPVAGRTGAASDRAGKGRKLVSAPRRVNRPRPRDPACRAPDRTTAAAATAAANTTNNKL